MLIDAPAAEKLFQKDEWYALSVNTKQRRMRMRDPNRIDKFLSVLGEAWKLVPDWRFFQLICNLQRRKGSDCFYMEDDEVEQFIIELFRLGGSSMKGSGLNDKN